MAEKYKNSGLTVLAVNAWDEEKEVLSRFVSDNKLKQRILLDGRDVCKNLYGQKGIPVVLWIDRSGKIVRTHIDFTDKDAATLDEYTAKLVASR